MDRNLYFTQLLPTTDPSLSARRAWIEMCYYGLKQPEAQVALRKESVDRNLLFKVLVKSHRKSLSARRAWIEIMADKSSDSGAKCRSPQGERG